LPSGQFFDELPENGWIAMKSWRATGGIGIFGFPMLGMGNAGKKVNGKCATAARNSSRFVPYQE
jgi:hypothetical protein